MKIIKLTINQLCESQGDDFTYLKNNDASEFTGNSEISASGKVEQSKYGNPVTTDDVSSKITPQFYNRYANVTQNSIGNNMRESYEDTDNDGIDNFYENDDIETLVNDDKTDNMTRIPKGVENKIDILIDQIKDNKLDSRQQAIVITKLIKSMDLSKLPFSLKKNIIKRINTSGNATFD